MHVRTQHHRHTPHKKKPVGSGRPATLAQTVAVLVVAAVAISLLVRRSGDFLSGPGLIPPPDASLRDCVYGVRASPPRCPTESYSLAAILRATKSQWIHFVGDSLTRQAYYGFLALMTGKDDPSAVRTEKIAGETRRIATTTISFRYAARFSNLTEALAHPPTNLAKRSPTLIVAGSGLHNLLYEYETLHADFEDLVPHIEDASEETPLLWSLISPINDSQLTGHRLESAQFRDANVQRLNAFEEEHLLELPGVRLVNAHAAEESFADSSDGLHSPSQALAAARGVFHSLAYLSADEAFPYTITGNRAVTAGQIFCTLVFSVVILFLVLLEANLMVHWRRLESSFSSLDEEQEMEALIHREITEQQSDEDKSRRGRQGRSYLVAPPAPPLLSKLGPHAVQASAETLLERAALWYVSSPRWRGDDALIGRRALSNPESSDGVLRRPGYTSETSRSFRLSTEIVTRQQALRAVFVFSMILCTVYLFDGPRHLMGDSLKSYNRDLFIFICLSISICAYLTRSPVSDKSVGQPLSREQTEEWKGFMQIMFVLYHYFDAMEIYNLIRVFIAAYIWLTGFGNFSYFYSTGDFSLSRVLKVLYRINFLAAAVCLALNKEYMLYYICPLHTLFFLLVYVTMGAFSQYNEYEWFIKLKLLTLAAALFLVFEVSPTAFATLSQPMAFLLNVNDSLHEWSFRVTLDHWVAFLGAVFAYNLPSFKKLLVAVDSSRWSHVFKALIVVSTSIVLGVWIHFLFTKEKLAYNAQHPYTSIVPILCYVVLRNVSSTARNFVSSLLQWLGKMSLEMYILQFHVFMCDDAKVLVTYIEGYPMANFVAASCVYVGLSHAVFRSTSTISNFWIPRKSSFSSIEMCRRTLPTVVVMFLMYVISHFFAQMMSIS